MTVKELIKKLKKMPQDAIVTVENNYTYVNGEYEVDYIENYEFAEPQTVEICTNYKHRIE